MMLCANYIAVIRTVGETEREREQSVAPRP